MNYTKTQRLDKTRMARDKPRHGQLASSDATAIYFSLIDRAH